MAIHIVDGLEVKQLLEAALTWLRTNQQTVNAYNVFPVPDGDTGTNMVLTLQSAFDEVKNSAEKNAGRMAQAIAHGALMGARGNSGVILSQIMRGFARALDDSETLDADHVVRALSMARDTAYKGVVRPVEGTILTVTKDIAAEAEAVYKEYGSNPAMDMNLLLERVIVAADASVQRTPELLPVLKQAGVVDSGGKGLFFIVEGMLRFTKGLPLDTATAVQPLTNMQMDEHLMDLVEDGQDYEVVLDFVPSVPLQLEAFYEHLETIGTSIQLGEGDGLYRLHIHVPSEQRYTPIDYAMSIGTVTKVAIENLQAQVSSLQTAEETVGYQNLATAIVEDGQNAVVAVAPGKGIGRVFASLGVNAIIEGGQTMNPSTQEILSAIENLPSQHVFILPNNKNIILAAQTAAGITAKDVAIIPSRSIPQGLTAMLHWDPEGDFETLRSQMVNALSDVQTGEITIATRSVELNGVDIEEGQIIGLHNGDVVVSSTDLNDAILKLLAAMNTGEYELVTLFYGANISKQQASQVADAIRSAFPQQEVEIQEGGQPHYQFIIGVE